MKERILLFLITLSLFSHPSFSKFAKVILVKGKVTQLAPGELLARKVSKDDLLKIDTSILTGKGSFIRMILQDGSTLSLGPESKIVLNQIGATSADKSVIGLLKGSIRNKVEKAADGKMHFFIKTKTAALGVRGTEFETVYGPKTGVTSLLTYKGSVSMAHTKEVDKVKAKVKKDIEYSRESEFDKSLVIEEEVEVKEISDPIEKMEAALNADNASTVKAGQLSQTVDRFESVAKPVVINPVQLNLLYSNDQFEEGSGRRKKADLDSHDLKIKPVATDTPAEGIYDDENKIYAPKAGGFFDRKTGFYVPPSEDALFDKQTQVFVDKELGNVDAQTGEYVPPLGLEIDPMKGFVKKQFKPGTPKELLAKVESNQKKLNAVLDQAIVVGDGPDKDIEKEVKRYLSYRELISKNVIWLNMSRFSQTFELSNNTTGDNREDRAGGSTQTTLGIGFDSGSRLKPYAEFSLSSIEFDRVNSNTTQGENKVTAIGVGLKYSTTAHWNFLAQVKMDQQLFIHYSSTDSGISSEYTSFVIPKIFLGIQGEWFRHKKLSGELEARLGTNIGKTSGDMDVSTGLSYGLNLGLRYWPSKNWYLIGHLFTQGESYTVSGDSYIYEYDASRLSSGATLGLGSYF